MPTPHDERAPHRQQRWIECENVSQSKLEPFSVVQISQSTRPDKASVYTPDGGRTVLQVQEAQWASPENTAVLGEMAIEPEEFGFCTLDYPTYALWDGTGLPLPGEMWGLSSGGTELTSTQTGFVIVGDANYETNLVRVRWHPTPLVELCLSEDHPGRGIKFGAYLGWWDVNSDGWRYEGGGGANCYGAGSVAAIDWRYDVPYPTAGAKGLFTPRLSDAYGIIYECVSLDCDSPDEDCCTYETS